MEVIQWICDNFLAIRSRAFHNRPMTTALSNGVVGEREVYINSARGAVVWGLFQVVVDATPAGMCGTHMSHEGLHEVPADMGGRRELQTRSQGYSLTRMFIQSS